MDISEGSFVIGYDFSKGEGEGHVRDTLIVMQGDRNNRMKVINAFYDEEAHDIYNRLTAKKEDK